MMPRAQSHMHHRAHQRRSTRGPSHVHAGRGRVRAFGDGVVDSDCASVDFHARDGITSFARILDVFEGDEAESAAATRLPVVDDRHLLDVTVTTENVVQGFLA